MDSKAVWEATVVWGEGRGDVVEDSETVEVGRSEEVVVVEEVTEEKLEV